MIGSLEVTHELISTIPSVIQIRLIRLIRLINLIGPKFDLGKHQLCVLGGHIDICYLSNF